MLFLSRWEQSLHEIRFVWIQTDVGEKRDTIRTHWNAASLLKYDKCITITLKLDLGDFNNLEIIHFLILHALVILIVGLQL